MNGVPLTLRTADGTALAAMRFDPPATARGAVLIAGALAVPQRFYAPFAAWLAQQGWRVMTFDPRGIGASRTGPLRRVRADMLVWARQDFGAAVAALCGDADAPQVAVVGHSLGAHHAGMTDAPTQARIGGLLSVAAGAGYWRDWAAPSRRGAPWMLHAAGPLLTPLFGYFPGRRLGMVGDLPAGVMRQWSRWCRHPDFAWGVEPDAVLPALHHARFPVHALGFTDDEAMTEVCTRRLFAQFTNAPVRVEMLAPAQAGVPRIGHLGAFRREMQGPLWPRLAERLSSVAAR